MEAEALHFVIPPLTAQTMGYRGDSWRPHFWSKRMRLVTSTQRHTAGRRRDTGTSVAYPERYERFHIPGCDSSMRSAGAAFGFPCPRGLLRPQQGPVPRVRVQGPEDRSLRYLLLPGRRGGGADGVPHGGALVHTAL